MTIGNLCVWLSNLLLSFGPWLVGFLFCYNSIGNVCHMTNIKTTFLQSNQKCRKPNIFINNFFQFWLLPTWKCQAQATQSQFQNAFFPHFNGVYPKMLVQTSQVA